jgi:hypothetical protein
MHRIFLLGLLLGGVAVAGHNVNPSKDWNGLREKNIKLGFTVERVDQTLAECRKNGLSVGATDALLCSVYTAHAESLPTDYVFLKIEEGLAKHADVAKVAVAADARLVCMRKADALILTVRESRGGEHQHLVMHSCVVLESGLPEEVLLNIFNRPGGFRYGRMIHAVEAAETLQLDGLAPEHIEHLMMDCLDRDLNRIEVFRAVDFVVVEHRAGKDFDTIHDELWVVSDL